MVIDSVLQVRNLLTLIFGSIGLILTLVGGIIIYFKFRRLKEYTRTAGTVVGFAHRPGKTGDFLYAPIVEIHVNGRKHKATSRVATSWTSAQEGDSMYVYYDPKNPNRMVFDSWMDKYLVAGIFGIMGIVWLLVTLIVFVVMS